MVLVIIIWGAVGRGNRAAKMLPRVAVFRCWIIRGLSGGDVTDDVMIGMIVVRVVDIPVWHCAPACLLLVFASWPPHHQFTIISFLFNFFTFFFFTISTF
ncbi:hypothetical protein GLYMA_10G162350v4 [Glycine max]|nr:hypothetical protein GLYMA_10G162350v4 [Glycine max]KAH1138563.1 hypothetical protein GYH30_028180 [Glycine max]